MNDKARKTLGRKLRGRPRTLHLVFNDAKLLIKSCNDQQKV